MQIVIFHSFLWLNNISFYVCTTASFMHSSVDRHLGCFHILATVNSTTMNSHRGEYILFEFEFWASLAIFPEVESLGQKADPFLIFWGISILLSTVVAPVCIPTNSAKGSSFPTSLPALVVCWFIDHSHSDRCEMVSCCGFNLHLTMQINYGFKMEE